MTGRVPAASRSGPLTAAQRAMLTVQQLRSGDASTNSSMLYEITGQVDAQRLRDAVQTVLRSARALNVTFRGSGGEARFDEACFEESGTGYVVEIRELSGTAAEDRSAVVAHAEALADTPFPPGRWPLYEAAVWTSADRVYLTVAVSHLIADVTALWLLFDLIELAYADPDAFPDKAAAIADLGVQPADLPPPDEPDARTLDRVRTLLEAASGTDSGPVTGVRRPDGVMPGRTPFVSLPPEIRTRIEKLVSDGGITPFSFFLGAHLVLLSRFAGSTAVATSVPLPNRFGRAAGKTLGNFINILPLGIEMEPAETFADLCRRLAASTLGLLKYQAVDVADVRAAQPEAALGRLDGLAVDTAFTYYRRPVLFSLPGCQVTRIDIERRHVRFPLAIAVEHGTDAVKICVDTAQALLPADPVSCYLAILDQASARPDQKLAEISLLGEQAAAAVDAALNDYRPLDADDIVTTLDRLAARQPDAVAVADARSSLTRVQLQRRAEQVARWLVANIDADHVAVSGRRGTELMAATIGVLKAGKAFVPIDPLAPSARLEAVTKQFTDLPLLAIADAVPGWDAGKRVEYAAVLEDAVGVSGPADFELPRPRPDATAYIIFTSGTTGTPKGVEVTRGAFARHYRAAQLDYGTGPEDVWALLHAPTFDMAVWEIFGALTSGARLEIVAETVARSPADLAAFLLDRQVTVVTMTPSAFTLVLAELRRSPERIAVRLLALGGEAVRFAALREWFELRGDDCRVYNQYGPTETTMFVTHHEIDAEAARRETGSVIGRPLADVTAHVVDADLHPVPIGIPGELLIGGDSLARGYFGAPELTAAAFITDARTGKRMYRTGDRVVQRPDGVLAFEGRRDGQVQIRGYRVELGEVESALHAQPEVRDVAVRVYDPDGGRPRLVAYLVGDSSESAPPADSELRDRLRERLPAYMVPSHFVYLPELPLNSHGKVADALLPPPLEPVAQPAPAVGPGADRPASALQAARQTVRDAWRESVGVTNFRDEDNFFDIGGTSMHVAQVHGLLLQAVPGLDLDMIDLFEYTTVEQLAARIARVGGTAGEVRARRNTRRRRDGR
ncbi:MAG: amino acid adenylation domain-containing protein [Catenulispora sp.]|nr:amino acid adenylation domain-containing protein [Catenulispora sp.]